MKNQPSAGAPSRPSGREITAISHCVRALPCWRAVAFSVTVSSPPVIACANRFSASICSKRWRAIAGISVISSHHNRGSALVLKTDPMLRPHLLGQPLTNLFRYRLAARRFRCHSTRLRRRRFAPSPRCMPPDRSTPLQEAGHERYPL